VLTDANNFINTTKDRVSAVWNKIYPRLVYLVGQASNTGMMCARLSGLHALKDQADWSDWVLRIAMTAVGLYYGGWKGKAVKAGEPSLLTFEEGCFSGLATMDPDDVTVGIVLELA
jgi:hypothetical protein